MSRQNNDVLPPEGQPSTSSRSQRSSNIALGLIGGSFVTIMALTTPFITMQLKSSLPYMSTPRQKVEKALTFLSKRNETMLANHNLKYKDIGTTIKSRHNESAAHQKQLHFVDLGSGDGTAVLAASSLGWRATGIEMNPTLWLMSSIRRLLSNNKKTRMNSELKIGDMFDASISQSSLRNANCTMIFGVAPLMPRISNMIETECRTGCWIMSYRFRVPLASGYDVVKNKKDQASVGGSGGIHASLIYDEEEMRIYELNSVDTTEEDNSNNTD
eukprot:scaffold18972_cov144-Skeletonema_marinoi.AAC.7